eukprot:3472183-Pyramimonas_sp.AAC.1
MVSAPGILNSVLSWARFSEIGPKAVAFRRALHLLIDRLERGAHSDTHLVLGDSSHETVAHVRH